jgi:hypothetical protein
LADRKVSVGLELKASGFKAEATAVEGKVESLDREVNKLDRSITRIPPDAARAAASMRLLGDEGGRAGAKFDEFGRRTTSLQQVDQRIIKTRGEVRALAEEFNRTGDVHVLERMFGADRELKQLTAFRGRLAKDLGDAGTEGGKEFSKNFSSTSQGILSTPGVGPIVAGAIVAAVVAALPAINGLLLGATGLGGIGLGIVGQLHDPQVHKAFADMGSDLMKVLSANTTAFKAPLIGSIQIFGDALKDAIRGIDFTSLAKSLAPFVSGIANMIRAIGPGLNEAFAAAGPILAALAADLPTVGRAISDMFSDFARGGKGAQEALRALTILLIGVIEGTGRLVYAVSKLFEWFVSAGHAIGDFASKLDSGFPLIDRWGGGVKKIFDSLNASNDVDVAGRALKQFGDNASLSADELQKLDSKIGQFGTSVESLTKHATTWVLDTMVALDRATLSFDESLTRVTESVKQNGKSLDEHSAKGQANREAILGMVGANVAAYQANLAANMTLDEATAKYNENQKQIEKTAIAAYGNTAAVHGMIDKYRDVPGKIQTDIAMNGLTSAIDNLGELLREIYGLPPRRDIFITVHHDEIVRQINEPGNFGHTQRWGGITEHAQEGLLSAKVYAPSGPARYAFAEPATGGEAFVPRFGDYRRSTSILDQAARWYGGRFVAGGMGGGGYVDNRTVTYQINDATDPSRVVAAIKRYEQSNGKNWRS